MLALFFSLLIGCSHAAKENDLKPIARIDFDPINESSALVASPLHEGVFWTLNDSGDEARLFAIDSTGALIKPDWVDDYSGLMIDAAVNIDWEDLCADDAGNLIIGACGNNGNARKDLAVYILPEPDPRSVHRARALRRIDFSYPDQQAWPPVQRNFDCEAVFFAQGALHVVTKHRSDDRTKLYRLDAAQAATPWYAAFEPGILHELTLLGEQQVAGLHVGSPSMVTAADSRPDGSLVVLLSYHSIYSYTPTKKSRDSGNWLEGTRRWLPIAARQCEAIAIRGDWLWITNEQRDIFRVQLDELEPD